MRDNEDQFICNLYSIFAFPSCVMYVHTIYMCMCVYVCTCVCYCSNISNNKNVRILGTVTLLLSLLFTAHMRHRETVGEGEISSSSRDCGQSGRVRVLRSVSLKASWSSLLVGRSIARLFGFSIVVVALWRSNGFLSTHFSANII